MQQTQSETQLVRMQLLSEAETFQRLYDKGVEAWTELGRFVANSIDLHGNVFISAIVDRCDGVTAELVRMFERIGRGLVLPKLIISDHRPGVKKLLKFPLAVQEKYASEPVPLLVTSGGEWSELLVDVHNLTKDQAEQVFSSEGIRSTEAQRAFIENKSVAKEVPRLDLPYRLAGNEVIVFKPCRFTKAQLRQLWKELD